MPTIEVRAQVELGEPIVLSTQDNASFPPMRWQLSTGDRVEVTMDVSHEELAEKYRKCAADGGNWFVNSRVETLTVLLELTDVAADDLDRLYGRHPSASRYVVYDETPKKNVECQEAKELGVRVSGAIREAVNTILRLLRNSYGQYWLHLLEDNEAAQNFLNAVHAAWREGEQPWTRLFIGPIEFQGGLFVFGGHDQYLEIKDWRQMQEAITDAETPLEGYVLLSDAKVKFYQGDIQTAVIHLHAALEWTVQFFLSTQLAGKIPEKSLREMQRQSYGRLLNDWVKPLARDRGLDLTDAWESIRRIQKLRNDASHPTVEAGLAQLTSQEFTKLARHASAAVSTLIGLKSPKTPLVPLGHHLSAGTV